MLFEAEISRFRSLVTASAIGHCADIFTSEARNR
jgi:hypothetical protein